MKKDGNAPSQQVLDTDETQIMTESEMVTSAFCLTMPIGEVNDDAEDIPPTQPEKEVSPAKEVGHVFK